MNRFLCKAFVTHSGFHTQTLLHNNVFIHKPPVPTDACTHKRFCTQTHLHAGISTHGRLYRQTPLTLLHTDRLYAQTRLHTESLTGTNAFTYNRFYIQTILHTKTFAHTSFCTQNTRHGEGGGHFQNNALKNGR